MRHSPAPNKAPGGTADSRPARAAAVARPGGASYLSSGKRTTVTSEMSLSMGATVRSTGT